ncbi:MAG: nucleoside hydrolase [Clostridia bacterium]|nr:nucleoside hydrolase [Clostridia bacterium]
MTDIQHRIPVLIDTDPGVDDAFCLGFGAAYADELDLKGVTAMGGNNYTSVTTRNALALLQFYHRTDVPVAPGATAYLTEEFGTPVAKFHGANGLGNQEIPDPVRKPEPMEGCDFIYKVAKECGGKLVIVTVCPETNLAKAFRKYPDLPGMIEKIVVMGGSTTTGNITPYAEANIRHDVPAADVVFNAGVPIDMIGLNLTRQCVVPDTRLRELATECRPELLDFLCALIRFRNGETMHDAVAIATLIDETVTTWERGTVKINTDPADERYGETVFTPDPNGTVRVGMQADYAKYEAMFAGMANRMNAAR